MYNYRTLSKAQLIELVNSIESQLTPSISMASEVAKNYSPEPVSKLAYEVGYLNGCIKNVLSTIEAYKECSK
jgi:MFS-type transporter involved in bile tolerance (Atg22 family)